MRDYETKADVEADYEVVNGRIISPGKFEGEAVYAPYFHQAWMNGDIDEHDSGVDYIDVNDIDRKAFPELATIQRIAIYEDNNGFVYVYEA